MFDRVPVIIHKIWNAGVYCNKGSDKFQKKITGHMY